MSKKNMQPPDEYYQGTRQEVAALIPDDINSVLDVGCGFGGLGKSLRNKGVKVLYGVEINPAAAPFLHDLYDEYWIGSVESIHLPESLPKIDCIVFADVLEHLIDPSATLSNYTRLMGANGVVVASIPNVRNLNLLYNLLFRGRWKYEDSGLLDRTHLRFFTRIEIEKLFSDAELLIEVVDVNLDRYGLFQRILTAIPRFLIPDLQVCQFLIRARRKSTDV